MNGAGPPDRGQSLGLLTLLGRTRAQMPCPVFSCNKPEEKHTACGSRDDEAPNCGYTNRAAGPDSPTLN